MRLPCLRCTDTSFKRGSNVLCISESSDDEDSVTVVASKINTSSSPSLSRVSFLTPGLLVGTRPGSGHRPASWFSRPHLSTFSSFRYLSVHPIAVPGDYRVSLIGCIIGLPYWPSGLFGLARSSMSFRVWPPRRCHNRVLHGVRDRGAGESGKQTKCAAGHWLESLCHRVADLPCSSGTRLGPALAYLSALLKVSVSASEYEFRPPHGDQCRVLCYSL